MTDLWFSYFVTNLWNTDLLPSLAAMRLLCCWGLQSIVKCFGANYPTNGHSITAALSSYTADVQHVSPFPCPPPRPHSTYIPSPLTNTHSRTYTQWYMHAHIRFHHPLRTVFHQYQTWNYLISEILYILGFSKAELFRKQYKPQEFSMFHVDISTHSQSFWSFSTLRARPHGWCCLETHLSLDFIQR